MVVKKLAILENLLFDFLQMGKDMERQTEIELFLARNLAIDVETLRTDMDFYMESLEDLMRKVVRSDSKLLEVGNRLSLLAMVVYSYKEDIDLDDWLKEYAEKNDTYFADQKKNFIHMKNDLYLYINRKKAA